MSTARLALACLVLSAVLQAQQTPVFRAGVDLVSVDVVVLDRSGSPISTLTTGDFTIVAGRKPRRIVSAEYIDAKAAGEGGGTPMSEAASGLPSASSNTRQPAGRTLIFAVDLENILAGEGRLAMKGIADYLDRLGPNDRVGLMTLPSGTPRVEPTTDRDSMRAAVTTLAGISMRLRDREMTFGEAAGIFVNDRRSLAAYWYRIVDQGYAGPSDRTCAPQKGPFEAVMTIPAVCVQAAERIIERSRYHTRGLLDRLRALVEAMAPISGPKAIVLVSGGLMTDAQTLTQMSAFTAAAERSRVSLYALQVEAPAVESSSGSGNTTDTKRFDNQVGLAGLGDVAVAARGAAQRLQGESITALARIDRELSGYYLLTFERDAADRDGARVGIEVRTNRDDLQVIARKEFTAIALTTAAADTAALKAAVGDLLKSPAPASHVPMEVDAYAMPVAGTGGEARVLLAVDIARYPASVAAIGFQVANADGKVLADGFEAPVTAGQPSPGRAIVIPAFALTPGRFIARIAVVDTQGQRGSVQHAFEIAPWADGPVRLSDVILGHVGPGGFQPGARVPSLDGTVGVRLVVRDQTAAFANFRVRVMVTNAADNVPVENIDVPLLETADRLRRMADVVLRTTRYAPGAYIVTAMVTANGEEIARRSRVFRK